MTGSSEKKQNSTPWWKHTTVYQIYPRSFQDTNGDGIGDLEGIISRLDYLRDTGFETLWISPFYPSPQEDLGYDIMDYYGIDPDYGSLETFDRLAAEVHRREMKLVLDMVLNHTSDRHPWFIESSSSRSNPRRDWYIWRDGRGPGVHSFDRNFRRDGPPNNWTSMVSGPGWHYHEKTGQWYWASFLPFQPDLNYRNPEVKEEMFRMLRFWLRRGVDGFRLDIIGSVYEDPEFRNNPPSRHLLPDENNEGMLFRSNRMTRNHPDNFEFARELRALIDEFNDPPRFLVGETFGDTATLRRYCSPDGLNLVFLFKSMAIPFRARTFRRLIEEFEHFFSDPYLPTWVFSNHDRTRRFSVLDRASGNSGNAGKTADAGSAGKVRDTRKARLNALLQFTARGVPFTYYGEEIGMRQGRIHPRDSLDAVAHHFGVRPAWKIRLLNRLTGGAVQRDGARTPMQWDGGANGGFTKPEVQPWLPVNSDTAAVNVEDQLGDPDSLLSFYRRLLRLRRERPALHGGSMELLPEAGLPREVLGYTRRDRESGEKLTVFVNFCGKTLGPITLEEDMEILLSSCSVGNAKITGGKLRLPPYGGVVLIHRL